MDICDFISQGISGICTSRSLFSCCQTPLVHRLQDILQLHIVQFLNTSWLSCNGNTCVSLSPPLRLDPNRALHLAGGVFCCHGAMHAPGCGVRLERCSESSLDSCGMLPIREDQRVDSSRVDLPEADPLKGVPGCFAWAYVCLVGFSSELYPDVKCFRLCST